MVASADIKTIMDDQFDNGNTLKNSSQEVQEVVKNLLEVLQSLSTSVSSLKIDDN